SVAHRAAKRFAPEGPGQEDIAGKTTAARHFVDAVDPRRTGSNRLESRHHVLQPNVIGLGPWGQSTGWEARTRSQSTQRARPGSVGRRTRPFSTLTRSATYSSPKVRKKLVSAGRLV